MARQVRENRAFAASSVKDGYDCFDYVGIRPDLREARPAPPVILAARDWACGLVNATGPRTRRTR